MLSVLMTAPVMFLALREAANTMLYFDERIRLARYRTLLHIWISGGMAFVLMSRFVDPNVPLLIFNTLCFTAWILLGWEKRC